MKWSNDPVGAPWTNPNWWLERAKGWAKDAIAAKVEYHSDELARSCAKEVWVCLKRQLEQGGKRV